GGWAIGQVRLMTLTGVDDHDTRRAGHRDQRGQRRDYLEQLVHIIAEAFTETPGQQEVSLHFDHDECGLACDDRERGRFGGYVDCGGHRLSSEAMETVDDDVETECGTRGSSRRCAAS